MVVTHSNNRLLNGRMQVVAQCLNCSELDKHILCRVHLTLQHHVIVTSCVFGLMHYIGLLYILICVCVRVCPCVCVCVCVWMCVWMWISVGIVSIWVHVHWMRYKCTVSLCLEYSRLLMMVVKFHLWMPIPKGIAIFFAPVRGIGGPLRHPLTATDAAEVFRGPCMPSHYICLHCGQS